MLEVNGIDVFYGAVQALRGISLHVGEGEMVALLGANGAGKTTTLRAISGLVAPRAGSILLDGRDISRLRPQAIVGLGVAHLPEGRELFAELTVLENLRLGHWSRRKERGRFNDRLERVFDLFPRLKERADQASGTLSGGEQQMLAAARALISEPRLLLVDELSLGLAPIIVRQLFDAVIEVNAQGTAVLLVEQFVHMALSHTSRAYVLTKGELAIEAASSELLSTPELAETYLGSAPSAAGSSASPDSPNKETAHGGHP